MTYQNIPGTRTA